MKPNFFVIGTAKSATTTLFEHLSQCEDVGLPELWEPRFFCRDEEYAKGIAHYELYYKRVRNKRAIGEKSWTNSVKELYPHCRDRIFCHYPTAKILFIVRNPIERARSLWIDLRSGGLVKGNFNAAIREDPIFLYSSLYSSQISYYLEIFPACNVKVLFYEDFITDRRRALLSVCQFLNIKAPKNFDDVWLNRSHGKLIDNVLAGLIRKIPEYGRLRDNAPPHIRSMALKLLKYRVQLEKVEWDNTTKKWFIDRLRDDNQHLLKNYYGSLDIWPIF